MEFFYQGRRIGLNLLIELLGLCFISFPLNKKLKLLRLYFPLYIINRVNKVRTVTVVNNYRR